MKMTVKEAQELLKNLENELGEERWINHSICVGNAAERIAGQLNLDRDKAKTLGYIHDIGKYFGKHKNHATSGYNYIKSLGYDDEYANICLTHSFLNNDVRCVAGGTLADNPSVEGFIANHEYTIYEKIINLCDLMCTDVLVTIDKRLIDIIIRRGAFENTQYHVKESYKLKKYMDELLGYDVYNLFPEIKDNM